MFCLVPRQPTPPPPTSPPPDLGWKDPSSFFTVVFLPPSNSLRNISDFLRIFAHFQACVTRAHAQRIQHYNRITKNKFVAEVRFVAALITSCQRVRGLEPRILQGFIRRLMKIWKLTEDPIARHSNHSFRNSNWMWGSLKSLTWNMPHWGNLGTSIIWSFLSSPTTLIWFLRSLSRDISLLLEVPWCSRCWGVPEVPPPPHPPAGREIPGKRSLCLQENLDKTE